MLGWDYCSEYGKPRAQPWALDPCDIEKVACHIPRFDRDKSGLL